MGANKQQTVTESILPALCPQIMHPWLQSSEFWDVVKTLVTVLSPAFRLAGGIGLGPGFSEGFVSCRHLHGLITGH